MSLSLLLSSEQITQGILLGCSLFYCSTSLLISLMVSSPKLSVVMFYVCLEPLAPQGEFLSL